MRLDRRDFLRVGGAGLALGSLAPLFRCPFIGRPLQAAMMGGVPTGKKVLPIFMRGGCDGLHLVTPADDELEAARPTLFIPPEQSYDLNGFARANSSFQRIIEEVPPENMAWVHRVGYTPNYFSRSHFEGQAYWESAQPLYYGNQGWVNRLIRESDGISGVAFPGACIGSQQLLFQGPDPLPTIADLRYYNLDDIGISRKLLGALPSGDNGKGLLGIYSRAPDATSYDALVRAEGLALASSLEALTGLDPDEYEPDGGADYDTGGMFERQLRDAVMLLKLTDCMVAGIQLDGFDTHTGQAGGLDSLISRISAAITNVYLDTKDSIWNDLVIVTMSEFGRTSDENGAMGTDHGEASVMLLAGGGVNGGVYNCDSTTWSDGDIFSSPSGRYVGQKTDFRSVVAEIVDKHFGQGTHLNSIIPGWDDLSGPSFAPLGVIKST